MPGIHDPGQVMPVSLRGGTPSLEGMTALIARQAQFLLIAGGEQFLW